MDREIRTRNDVIMLLLDWMRPLKKCYSEGAAWLMAGNTAAHYNEAAARMEGYARVLWGLGPLFSQDNKELAPGVLSEIAEWKRIVRRGLINGTNPEHKEYWGDISDFDQKMVETAAIVNAILLSPDTLWTPLTKNQQENVYRWMTQINHHEVHANNWRFFRILVNMMFIKLGLAYDKNRMDEDWKVIEDSYEGDGWYFDGHPGQKDYYIAFAMHYYGLLYAVHMEKEEPERCHGLRQRAKMFFNDFIYWFDCEGCEVPFGRSLTYRFAHSAAFSTMAYAGVEAPLPILKHMILGNLRYWSRCPIFDRGGILSIGYQYPNLIMSEHYNAPGSPYWSFKTFLILALPCEHEFWRCAEEKPKPDAKRLLEHPHMIAVHEDSGHTLLYPAGQHSYNFGNTVAKYQKFVYSNIFGFSVSRGSELEEGAFDNTLAAAIAGENNWRMKNGEERYEVTENYSRILYEPVRGIRVESVIVPLRQGHVRIHFVHTGIDAQLADGGFAIRSESGLQTMCDDMVHISPDSVSCDFPWGNAGAVWLAGTGTYETRIPKLVKPFPNTNIMYGSTVIPTMYFKLRAGNYCIVDYFYGDAGKTAGEIEYPALMDMGSYLELVYGQEAIRIDKEIWL
ncbi:MAG: DUF2264 domain-containing protein [Lachnospiraceae bacterium]|nr:DUF2264 domain-containing protein [Lachnospiraceae bacterium]